MKRNSQFRFLEDSISRHLHCPICLDVFKDPLRIQCGQFRVFRGSHIFCAECLTKLKRSSETYQSCPACRKRIFTQAEKDLLASQLIGDLKVKCEECLWEGQYSDYIYHRNKCAKLDTDDDVIFVSKQKPIKQMLPQIVKIDDESNNTSSSFDSQILIV